MIWRRRQWSPQRRVHPPPWGAGGLLSWTGLRRSWTEEKQEGLRSQTEAGVSSQRVFDQHVWASLQKMEAGTEAGVGAWAESLEARGLSVLLLFWYWLQTERDDTQQRTCELRQNLFFIHSEAKQVVLYVSVIIDKYFTKLTTLFWEVTRFNTAWNLACIGDPLQWISRCFMFYQSYVIIT